MAATQKADASTGPRDARAFRIALNDHHQDESRQMGRDKWVGE